jgi:hypothetical protein
MRIAIATWLALSLLVATGACGDDESTGASSSSTSGGSGSAGGPISSCTTLCNRIALCHGFADEKFGKDEAECNLGCEAATPAEQQPVFQCVQAASCDQGSVAACDI